jgi:dihydrofolate reductase
MTQATGSTGGVDPATFLTLDGVMPAPGDTDEDRRDAFEQGGWQAPYADEDLGRLAGEWLAAADAFLLGRRTYELFAAFWPQVTDPDDPVASRLNALPKYVASTTLDKVEWHNSTLLEGDVAKAVAELKRQPGNELQIHGSGQLARTLMAHDLIDEYRLWTFPVLLGSGKRLFDGGTIPAGLGLIDSRSFATGVVLSRYRRAGDLRFGSFEVDARGGVEELWRKEQAG